ncbi:MAG TPA: TetR family transcriptional regulator [Pseudonocardiaceae bacterium]|nr:TetR family transcriptional regulator [Pseudonocardiaceae bacterium]
MATVTKVERADAARNRQRVLEAAGELFAELGARNVTMGDIAAAAGVGRGTLYRRYPDIASIAMALLDEHERALQKQLISGPPPLGPGATPAERLAAFYVAMVELLEQHVHLILGAETGQERFAVGAYGFWRVHVRSLLIEAGTSNVDALVDILLAPLDPDVYQHQRHTRNLRPDEISAALTHLAHALLTKDGPGGDPAHRR